MGYAIRLAGTPAGQYLVAVEEREIGRGRQVVVTDDPAQARRWADPVAARRFWAESGLPSDVAFEIDQVADVGAEVCDFCSAPRPVWAYPAWEFAITAHGWGSAGDWAACTLCADLIERGDWTALAVRAVDTNPQVRATAAGQPAARALAVETAGQLHRLFRQARTDAARHPLYSRPSQG
ncbi:MAG: hypothetical protein JO023_01965 [Chloroflexi bacterium]|nr:hypothetical protein [Chloroflexota bacterium]